MALYLKYRPQDFKSLIGQEFVKSTIQRAVAENKTVGAYLLCGPR
jgi:DNA polymerase-3 subunit gamma/tau